MSSENKEELLSVGIDLGTSTTQLVFSRLYIENMASSYTVPKMVITKKEIQYKSRIHFTPLIDHRTIDFEEIKKIVAWEYEQAGIQKEEIDTGAVIITGETARKENAKEVLNSLSGFAGDFVVATAGPDLESVISGKGAGTDVYSKENRCRAVNIDIGGGTSNLAVFQYGDTIDTGCLDVGGRLIKVEKDTGKVTYISSKMQEIISREHLNIAVGQVLTKEAAQPLLNIMTEALEQSVGLRSDSKYYEMLITNKGIEHITELSAISFSGGVAAVLYHPMEYENPFAFGDIGIWLAETIRKSRIFTEMKVIESAETIRATVVGAGSHTTKISGSTISYTNIPFPIKNLPVLKLTQEEIQGGLTEAIRTKLQWFTQEGKWQQVAVAFDGNSNPNFRQIQDYAKALLNGLDSILSSGLYAIVITEADMAKVLGQTMIAIKGMETIGRAHGQGAGIVCLDGIHLNEGDYIDIGRPVAEGSVLPVVVKTLVFSN